jgi:hypothetical protein
VLGRSATRFHQPLLQTGQRPVANPRWQNQTPPQLPEVTNLVRSSMDSVENGALPRVRSGESVRWAPSGKPTFHSQSILCAPSTHHAHRSPYGSLGLLPGPLRARSSTERF